MSHFTQNWMSYLEDSKSLNDLTIPGTHDTCTYNESNLAQCQTMNLETQFKNGIRFWDIRLKVKDGKMDAYHGIVSLGFTFDDILRTSTILLQQFPSECIVMSISHEKNKDNVELYEKLWPVIKDLDYWYKEDRIPKLGEVRGKIIFMRRFIAPLSNFPIGINIYDNWPDDKTAEWESSAGIKFCVQDKFGGHLSVKLKNKFENHVKPVLDKAKNNENRLYMNFTSGTLDGGGSVFFPPKTLAKETNRLLLDYLGGKGKARFGIIPMDFPESESGLIRKLIGCNFEPFHEIIVQKATYFANETDGTWTMSRYGSNNFFNNHLDLVFIKTTNTQSGKVEIKAASGDFLYQKLTFDKPTVFNSETNGTWLLMNFKNPFFLNSGVPQNAPELVFIKTKNTESKKVELHIASGSSGYQKMILQTATVFNCENDGVWTMAFYQKTSLQPDLIYIKTKNTASKKVEVLIASGASNYRTIILNVVTAFDCEEDGVWTTAGFDGYGADLVFIKTSNTASGYVEVYVASVKSQYKEFTLKCKTAFKCETNGTWQIMPFENDYTQDLVFIKTANTQNNHVELHVASGKR
ncbi:phosphatidylinositol-specific phospholipase C domain-containing protein [Flavobacterium sp. GA093]|uniref:1-phosphatidylinositol phosphodiesterase n=1 Tax=Flavobacterium hydrocarbonoxydans TaxID=2683249 RepID=A0A6I4NJ00_9FLAO|nr:phosphatidylinositol-specific phospholipase C [Flavobacterium hydrocarbonoxydans]MWB94358.1 phosphatidylinositol-specific phospholipase C domain-containing protein [Flavobacterium hydrocarbonoxydans]